MGAAVKLVWAQRLEDLAERLYADMEACGGTDPLARSAIVTGHALRGEWLKEYHLFSREAPRRKILAGVDAVALHPFVGDWLYAALEGKDPKRRRPSSHPYSMEVLRWRIDRLLGEMEGTGELEAEFPSLAGYLGEGKRGEPEGRRSALASKLAAMYGDYQTHRPEMLARWERGAGAGEEPACWQAALWRRLVGQGGESLVEQFARLERGADLSAAFSHGIPRYASVHVFGVSSMPRPYVSFFERLAEVVPVAVYAFNPSEEFWMEDPDWRQAWKRAMEDAASGADGTGRTAMERMADLAHPLLGTLGTGCKGLLAELLDRLEGNYEALPAKDAGTDTVLVRLQRHLRDRSSADGRGDALPAGDASVAVHRTSTPRREMEVLRDGLLGWFAAHPGARPRDAMVLCADWETYAPHAEAVFGSGAAGGGTGDVAALPCTLLGRGAADDPVAGAFLSLLELATSRMEAGIVLDLLAEPAVAESFGIGPEDLPALRAFVREANIRWGLDGAHAEEVMATAGDGAGNTGRIHAFTWRRGLDRLLLSALGGAGAEGGDMVGAGALGELLPSGDAEGERATLLGRLCGFIGALERLRGLGKREGTADFWHEQMLRLVAEFFRETDENHRSVAALREAASAVAARMREADAIAGGEPARHGWTVVADAVAEQVKGVGARAPRTPDSVLFAPLRAGIPSPRRFVWICGLNDGVFPRNPQRPAFDLMGRHPAPLDPSPRNDDALALLEAVCCARETLALSHAGRDPRTGKAVPPAPLAGALLDYLAGHFRVEGREVPYADWVHPLHGFSPRCFAEGEALPASYSAEDYAAARAIAAPPASVPHGTFAFLPEGRGEIGLEELAQAFANPSRAVLRSFASVKNPKFDAIDSDDALAPDGKLTDDPELSLREDMPEGEAARCGCLATEKGLAPEPERAARAILGAWADPERDLFRQWPLSAAECKEGPIPADGCGNIAEMLREVEETRAAAEVDVIVDVPLPDGGTRQVRVSGKVPAVRRRTADGGEAWFAPRLTPYMKNPFRQAEDWVRHLAANASGLRLASVAVCGKAKLKERSGGLSCAKELIQVLPPLDAEVAKERLGRILSLLCVPFPGGIPFHQNASAELARKANAALPGTLAPDEVRGILRGEWFQPFRPQADTAPGRTETQAEDAVLWPESPSVLDDGCMGKYAGAALVFWNGFPYLGAKKAAAKSGSAAKKPAGRRGKEGGEG